MWSVEHDNSKTFLAFDRVLTLELIDPAGSDYNQDDLAAVMAAVLNTHPPIYGWSDVCPPR